MLANEPPQAVKPKRPSFWIVENGQLNVYPHPGQARALASTKRYVMMIAGSQGGKTATGPVWILREMQLRGPGDYICITPTYTLLEMSMLPKFREFFEDALALGEWREAKHHFLLSREGSKVVFGEATSIPTRVIFCSAASPGALEAATALGAWCDELGQDQFGIGAWEAVERRCTLHRGRIFGTTTPYTVAGWFRRQIYDRWLNGDPDYDIVQFESRMNPLFSEEEYEYRRKVMQPWKFDLYYRGQFSRPTSLIFQDFLDRYSEDGGHKLKATSLHLQHDWERYIGIDFGSVVTCVVWIAHDPRENIYYVYRTQKMGRLSTEAYVSEVVRNCAHEQLAMVCGGAPSETQYRMDWSNCGLHVSEPPISDVESGIDRVVSLLRGYRIFFLDTLTDLITELNSYSREVDEFGEPAEGIHDKGAYHMLDALRYAVVGAFNPRKVELAGDEIARYFGFATKGTRDYYGD